MKSIIFLVKEKTNCFTETEQRKSQLSLNSDSENAIGVYAELLAQPVIYQE